jgi:hypothetical protein
LKIEDGGSSDPVWRELDTLAPLHRYPRDGLFVLEGKDKKKPEHKECKDCFSDDRGVSTLVFMLQAFLGEFSPGQSSNNSPVA